VVVAMGVIQWGCSSLVLSTRANQSLKYPSWEDDREGAKTQRTATASRHDRCISSVSPGQEKRKCIGAVIIVANLIRFQPV
jgi:hypothetical protein